MLRIRKSIKVLPGVRLNLSKGGTSWTIGRPGASINLGGKRGARITVGAPGTGVGVTVPIKGTAASAGASEQPLMPSPQRGADVISALSSAVLAFFGWMILATLIFALAAVTLGNSAAGGFAWVPTVAALVMAVRAYRRRRSGVV